MINFNKKQIGYSLVGIITGLGLMTFGAISSGAGHGPFPIISIEIALFGIIISVLSILFFIVLIISGLLGKEILVNYESSISEVPNYNWRCPKCDAVIEANEGKCICGFSIKT